MRERFLALLLPAPRDLLLVAVLLSALNVHMPDSDCFWHLKAGERFLAHGYSAADGFSFTAGNRPWFAHEWIPEMGMAIASRRFGLDALLFFKAVINAGTVALSALTIARAVPASPLLQVMIASLSFAALVPTFTPRPWMISFLLYALLIWIYGWEQRSFLVSTALLGGLLALWMNLHGMYAVGYVWLGLQLVGALADRGLGAAVPMRRAIVRPIAAMALGAAGALVHPAGFAILTYPFQYPFTRLHRENIIEWFPPDMNSAYGRYLLLLFAISLAALARAGTSATGFITTLALAFMAFTSRRNIPLFALGSAPFVAEALRRLLERARGAELPPGLRGRALRFLWRRHDNFNAVALTRARSRYALLLSILMAIFFFGLNPRHPPASRLFLTEAIKELYPVEATRFLLGLPSAKSRRIYNLYGWGGYLIFAGDGALRTFIDGRADLFGQDIFDDYNAIAGISNRWRATLDRYRIDTVLYPPDQPLPRVLALAGWQELHRDKTAVVMARPPAHSM